MKNVIAYYYDIHPFDIHYINNKYFFHTWIITIL